MPTNKHQITRSVPAIIIAAGESAYHVSYQVGKIYLRGNQFRSILTTFYAINLDPAGLLGLIPYQINDLTTGRAPFSMNNIQNIVDTRDQRRFWFREMVKSSEQIIRGIQNALHDIRVQEDLIQAGWEDTFNVPANLFVLIDANDPFSTGVFFPLLAILQDVLSTFEHIQAQLLIDCAVFPGDGKLPADANFPDQDLMVYTFLQELNDFLQQDSEKHLNLFKELKLQNNELLNIPVYLFDYRKEGTHVVRDRREIQVMLGNALLALLEDDAARQFKGTVDTLDVQESQGYYNGIGVAGVIYDPESLQKVIASRVANDFIKTKILEQPTDPQLALKEAQDLEKRLGTMGGWLDVLVSKLSPPIAQVAVDQETYIFNLHIMDFLLANLDYEHIHNTPWIEQIKEYDQQFQTTFLPKVSMDIAQNATQLSNQTLEELGHILDSLPKEARLYPGGLATIRKAVELTQSTLVARIHKADQLRQGTGYRREKLVSSLDEKLGIIHSLFSKLRPLPWLIRVLPRFLRKYLAPFYYLVRHPRRIYLLKKFKEECNDLFEDKCASYIEEQALNVVQQVIDRITDGLNQYLIDLAALEEKYRQTQAGFSEEFGDFPLAQNENGWLTVFRTPAVDEEFAKWVYTHKYPDLQRWLLDFFEMSELFSEWRAVQAEKMISWLDAYSIKAFDFLWTYDLEKIQELWINKPNDFEGESPLSRQALRTCATASIPLIRANFDAAGGPGYSTPGVWALLCHPEWVQCNIPGGLPGSVNWQVVYTGDPYILLYAQTLNSVKLTALVEMNQRSEFHYEGLEENERQRYEILSALLPDPVPLPPLENENGMDPNDPDVVKKVFRWSFQPRGSSKEVEQEISVYIRRSRYEYYRRMSRFSGEWNRYAEVETPEIRMLANEFQKLHAVNNWSTYNQAFNVLKFVQSCITYSFDRDSTGHQDWPRYPIETLMEGTGDCEDVAILCAAIISRLGFQVVLILYPQPAHLGFGVAGAEKLKGDYIYDPNTSRHYFYGEATSTGWHLGQIPKTYRDIQPEQIIPVSILIEDSS